MCTTCGCSETASVTITDAATGEQRALRQVEHANAHLYRPVRAHAHAHAPGRDGHDHIHPHDDAQLHTHLREHAHSHDHEHGGTVALHARVHRTTVALEHEILAKNQLLAERNRGWMDGRGILALNLVSSPGSGKTTLLERTIRVHFHIHAHDSGAQHLHAHSHFGESLHRASRHQHPHPAQQAFPLRALAIGMMHGMAGSAALILLSIEAVQSFSEGLIYIVLFGGGSIVGMALLSVVIAIPLRLSATRLAWLHKGMTAVVGGFSCLIGAVMVYRIGFAEGLLLG